LGLAIVYQIIRDHNGKINVRSAEGEGTMITIELPKENSRVNVPTAADGAKAGSPLEKFLKVKAEETKVSS
jgi:hypothetical protein